ncbi:unnamed protein product [Rhizoctonia solani]|uniref:Uncharacterized protein n=1 Tax=Rhizoctonia solani TaxID=456999 RepID=A0A8H3B4P1_9AGAM|nr:unnamed protein product [Rhizoctonia solani]
MANTPLSHDEFPTQDNSGSARSSTNSVFSEHSNSLISSEYNQPLPDPFDYLGGAGYEGGPVAKPLVELEMMRLSAELRGRPHWWIKYRNRSNLAKWKQEAMAQAEYMKENHIDYVLEELDGYAKLRDEATGVEVACYDTIWQSDTLIPPSLKNRLIDGVANLENVSKSEQDWPPRLNRQIFNLVNPSLYPIVYGRTLSYPEESEDRDPATLQVHLRPPHSWPGEDEYFVSKRFQWLPTDFQVSEDGKSVKSVSYINNIHPLKHPQLYKTIEEIVAAYIPLFERVLTDAIPENDVIPERTDNDYYYDEHNYRTPPKFESFTDPSDYNWAYEEWKNGRPIVLPSVREGGYEPGLLEKRNIKYTLGGRIIQVIVKLTNIYLTPDRPQCGGRLWRVEGMKNEAIAVCGFYYYDEENVSEGRLLFRAAVEGPQSYESGDSRGCKLAWGIGNGDPCVNELGSTSTPQDRCIALPNVYQHRISPFELVDKSKSGYRKMMILFLVDPAVHRPSTSTVPPQQAEWRASGINANPVLRAAFDKLPPEIIDHINSMVEGGMTREEADDYRLELIDEHTAFVEKNEREFFMASFDFDDS